jgi:hypothetical protein
MELDGVEPSVAVNEKLSEGRLEAAAEIEREYVESEREREAWEREREPRPDSDLLERRDRLLEEIDEQIAAELGVEEEYGELQDVRRQLSEARRGGGRDE